jgi:hypothetical protein
LTYFQANFRIFQKILRRISKNSEISKIKYAVLSLKRRFFYNEPFWDMSKNGGVQIFVKMDLKFSTYGPEHKTERFRSIEVIGNFWEMV